mmetsp:Transcript_66037/g.123164  ORF Transcript_66037/g.123164 Transcript_66037/m.123164 type:complete len:276 (+) Transcript_66037:85-912(+)
MKLYCCSLASVLLIVKLFYAADASQILTRRDTRQSRSFIHELEYKHLLRVCNAYPYKSAIDVYLGQKEKLTGDSPMPYKACRDFLSPMQDGDKLEFKIGDSSAGSFVVSDLPNEDAILLLVIHRHDTVSTAVSFESHVFANLLNSQLAIIDTYKGEQKSTPKIMDASDGPHGEHARREDLRYDTVVAVNPGTYEVALFGDEQKKSLVKKDFVAVARESYVVLRVGVEAHEGPSFPEELVVYPETDKSILHSSSAAKSGLLNIMVAAVALILSLRG